MTESINQQNEATLLGYFESLKGNFLLKFIFLGSLMKEDGQKKCIDPSKIPSDVINIVERNFADSTFYKALKKGNEELYLNYVEDMITALLLSSWNVFEQITKDLTKTDYATHVQEMSVCYTNGKFQFSEREKKDIELFYYIRNAVCHYNGAYHAYKKIDHSYNGIDFKTASNEGNKIEVPLQTAWSIACDLEKYTIKAWQSAEDTKKRLVGKKP